MKVYKIGHKIDEYDIVVRMNFGGRPESMTGEFKKIIGTKRNFQNLVNDE